ncbi:unnamed protein product [Adineta ricciae]|nr:unnamed protein product [Adineta ricciae]
MDQWLAACVACERAVTAIQGVRFIKHKSTQTAKIIIIILLIFNIGTTIHDPIHRRLIDEEDNESGEKRIWCITTYPSRLQTFDHFMNTCNFFVPFVINFVSVAILIIKKSYLQASTQTRKRFLHLFREQIHQHQHLLIAPIALIVLALPRLIISYVSRCMESIDDMWENIFISSDVLSIINIRLEAYPTNSADIDMKRFGSKRIRRSYDITKSISRTLESPSLFIERGSVNILGYQQETCYHMYADNITVIGNLMVPSTYIPFSERKG